jgi:hypothetical protein
MRDITSLEAYRLAVEAWETRKLIDREPVPELWELVESVEKELQDGYPPAQTEAFPCTSFKKNPKTKGPVST